MWPRLTALLLLAAASGSATTPATLKLPAFPLPDLVSERGLPAEISSVRLLRELHRGGVRGSGNLEAADADYALLRGGSLPKLAAWLESACQAVGHDLLQSRTGTYDGMVFARLLSVATALAVLQQKGAKLAMPIGVVICRRTTPWGSLPGDGAIDAYIIFATDGGMLVYDPPTRQLSWLADFPNKARIERIRF